MGKYSVPEGIRAMRPRGAMVKAIGGRCCVYEYRSVTEGGRRRTEMGPCIGSITEDGGFAPNGSRARAGEVTTLEFGQCSVALACSGGVLGLLREDFIPRDADQIYALAVVRCVSGMQPAKGAGRHFAMSVLPLRFSGVRLGPDALATLLDSLGRRQGPVMSFEAALCASSGPEVAVDGHAMPSLSRLSDLAEPGYRCARLGSDQASLLMAYDVESGRPMLSRMYEGSALDRVSVRDLLTRAEPSGKLFVVDAGFRGRANIEAFTSHGNSYTIPLHRGLRACREAVADPEADGRFVCRRGRRASAVEYRDARRRGARVILFRDLNKQALEQSGYLTRVERGAKGYTAERFDEARDLMGVIVLQTSHEDMSPRGGLRGLQAPPVGGDLLRLGEERGRAHVPRDAGLLQGPGPGVRRARHGARPPRRRRGLQGPEGQVCGRLPARGQDGQGEQGRGQVGVLQPPGEAEEALRALNTPLSVEALLPHT